MKRKQIIVLGLVLVIISVGILQYNYGKVGDSSEVGNLEDLALAKGTDLSDIPGAAVYVNNDVGDISVEDLEQAQQAQQATGFFAEARMERDKARSKQKEELKSMISAKDDALSASATLSSAEAQEQLVALIRRSEVESTIETLVKQRNFEDALVYMSDTGYVDVIVKADSLSTKEVAQISDIVVRHANVTMENITIKNVN